MSILKIQFILAVSVAVMGMLLLGSAMLPSSGMFSMIPALFGIGFLSIGTVAAVHYKKIARSNHGKE